MLAFGVISSAVPILSVYLPAFILYTLPQGLVLSVTLLRFEDKAYNLLALAVCVYLVMTTLFTRYTNRSILQSIRLQEQNALLIEDLNNEITHRESLIDQRTLELKEINDDLMTEIKVRERAEERLQQAIVDLDATLVAIPDPMLEVDENGVCLNLWTPDPDLLVAQKEQLIGNSVNEILPVDAASEVMNVIRQAAKTGTSHGQTVQLSLKDGIHWFELSTSKKHCTDGSCHYLMLYRDITDKYKMEDELLKVRKLESVGVLAGGIAHDFNNILSVILGNIELAGFRTTKDAKTSSLLEKAQKATIRAAKLTQQLLTFSKGGEPIKETTSLAGLIRDSADFILHGSQVSCDYSFADDLWMAHVDSGQISQVIQNIILNAKFAMPEGGNINISCTNVAHAVAESLLSKHEGDFVRITIQDTGTGISRDIMSKIFDGHITVDSSPGKGTTFTIYLPAEPFPDRPVRQEEKLEASVEGARIMVMDDETMILELAETQLSSLGHEAILVMDGEEAICTYQQLEESGTPVDLVIMDLTIPGGMGGQEAAQKLLQLAPEAKIIVASGYSNNPVMAHFDEYGFCAAVAKPFDLAELRKSINSALS